MNEREREKQTDNLEMIHRGDQASMLQVAASNYVHASINAAISALVAHYRGGQLSHDQMLGKIAEISALMYLLDSLQGDIRVGEAARDREYGDGTKAQRPATPGTGTRPKSA
jgi:hypothetical protein